MKNLMIKDLSITEELDRKTMTVVRGGSSGVWQMPSCFPTSSGYSYPSSTTTVSVSQANSQYQSNPTGNCSAVFGSSIYADNNQQGFNYIGH
jgi:hypothetical protein